MDRSELREILLDEFDVQTAYVDDTLKQVEAFEEGLKGAFFSFLQTKKAQDVKVGTHSYQSLVEKHKFTGIGAFLMLDWLGKDREAAEAALMFL